MLPRSASVALLAFALVACEQEDQQLPFTIEPDKPVEKTITTAEGGTVAAVTSGSGGQTGGVSVAIPANSVQTQTQVTVTAQTTQQTATTQQAVQQSGGGTIVQGTAFKLEPEGTVLAKPAKIDLKIPGAGAMTMQQKLGLSAVAVVGGKATPLSTPSIDLTNGLAKTEISTLGTIAMRVSRVEQIESGAPSLTGGDIFAAPPVGEEGAAGYNAGGTALYSLDCVGDNCSDHLLVFGGEDLVKKFTNMGAVINKLSVSLAFDRTTNKVMGFIMAGASINVVTGGGVSSKEYEFSESFGEGAPYSAPAANKISINGTTYEFGMTASGTMSLKLSETEVTYKDDNGNDKTEKVGIVIDLKRQ